jgi:hypothetical protein
MHHITFIMFITKLYIDRYVTIHVILLLNKPDNELEIVAA